MHPSFCAAQTAWCLPSASHPPSCFTYAPASLCCPLLQPRWEQEDAHDFLEYLVERMHQELLALARTDPSAVAAAGMAAQGTAAAAAAADAAKAAAEDEWLTKSGRRHAKRQQLRSDSETAVSALFRGIYVRCGGGSCMWLVVYGRAGVGRRVDVWQSRTQSRRAVLCHSGSYPDSPTQPARQSRLLALLPRLPPPTPTPAHPPHPTHSTVTCAGHPPSETPEPFVSPTLHILADHVSWLAGCWWWVG